MKRLILIAATAAAFCLIIGSGLSFAQATFKIPFKFEAEGKKYPPGDYLVEQKEEGKITLHNQTRGEEIVITFSKKLASSDPPIEAPQLIFDMVANFEPSYTEYITEYLLAEVWLTDNEGFLVLTAERSEYTKAVKGEKK